MAASVEKRDAYIGETKKQIRNGYGVYTYQNKFFHYEGEWQDGKKHGHGKLLMKDGSYYEGEFTKGEITGHGFRYWAHTENTYSGQFYMGELHGQGIMNYKDGSVYEGEWKNNKREGYGQLRLPDNSVYQGHLHNHQKHGEGTQIYSNGDRYDGDWVLNKRQGHGELRCSDGSIYDGQWANDMFNGQGTFIHSSGMTYEGLWINGQPAVTPVKLAIKTASPLEVIQGLPFVIEVECLTEDGEVAEVDKGREIQVTAGFKYTPPKDTLSQSRESSTLFDTIEDIEETPIETPFGYSVVNYPLTEILPEVLSAEPGMLSKSNTMLSEQVIQEDTEIQGEDGDEAGMLTVEPGTKEEDNSKEGTVTESGAQDSVTGGEGSELTGEAVAQDQPAEGTLMPPPVSSQRTDKGQVIWPNLLLPAAPPMYRPFLLLDEDDKLKKSKSRSSASSVKDKKEEESSRPTSKMKKERSSVSDEKSAKVVTALPDVEEDSELTVSKSDINLVPLGEYVIMVQDVTNPPFFGQRLETAFLLVKVIAPPKTKSRKSTAGSKKEKGPRWDTSKHIAMSMVQGHTDLAKFD